MSALVTAAGVVIAGIITGVVTLIVTRLNNRTASTGPDYIKTITQRIDDLEKKDDEKDRRIDDLETRLRDARADRDNFADALEDIKAVVREFIHWYNQGAKPPPPPIPAHLRDAIGDFELARVTEISRTTTQTERIVYPPEEQP